MSCRVWMVRLGLCLLALGGVSVGAVGSEDPTHPSGEDVPLLDHGKHHDAVVRVAPPTGDPVTDAANIAAAVGAATPGATIAFARGTYVMEGGTIIVSVPGVTLEGHRKGTTLQGVFHDDPADDFFLPYFQLIGGHQTVRALTFRDMHNPLSIGEPGSAMGGYRVEDCTFRENSAPFLYFGFSDEVSRVRRNRFINVVVPFNISGKTVHFRENRITSPDPAATPLTGQPFAAGAVFADFVEGVCENNVLEKNTVIGNADGFFISAVGAEVCRKNVVRENRFIGQRIFTNLDNGTMAWIQAFDGGSVERNVIKDNQLRGGEGLGIVAEGVRDNRIVDNEFRNLPGQKETFTPYPGTAIFLNELTTLNRVTENEFDDVVRKVVDLGTGNIVQEGDDDVAATRGRSGRIDNSKLEWLRERARR